MSAFFVVRGSVKDAEKLAEYSARFGPTIKAFGGELLTRGKLAGALVGNVDHHMTAIVKFPNMDAIDQWYHCQEYQALVPIRDQAMDVSILKYNEITS